MLNLLRGEFLKLKKGRNIWVCLIVTVIFIMFFYLMLNLVNYIQVSESAQSSIGVEADEVGGAIWNHLNILDVTQQVLGGIGVILTAVFACIFVIGEYNNGSIKNIVGKGYPRWKIFVAKYITAVVVSAFLLLFMVVVTFIFGLLIVGVESINISFLYELSVYAGIEIILGASFIGIIVLISELTRSIGAGITISMGIIIFSTLLTAVLDLICHSLSIKPSNYWLLDLYESCPVIGIDSSFVIRAVIISFVWIAISMTLGIVHFQKADIK